MCGQKVCVCVCLFVCVLFTVQHCSALFSIVQLNEFFFDFVVFLFSFFFSAFFFVRFCLSINPCVGKAVLLGTFDHPGSAPMATQSWPRQSRQGA